MGAVLDHLGYETFAPCSGIRFTESCLTSVSSRGEPPTANEATRSFEPSLSDVLPPWQEILPIAELYFLYCDSQPLPLFLKSSFLVNLQTRDVEVIYAMMALALRFTDSHCRNTDVMEMGNTYAEVARGLVMKRVSEGPVELSTLQCLCLLSLVDFASRLHPLTLSDTTNTLVRRKHPSLQHSQQPRNESRTMCESRPRTSQLNMHCPSRRAQTLLLEHMSTETIARGRLLYSRSPRRGRPAISPESNSTSEGSLSGRSEHRSTKK